MLSPSWLELEFVIESVTCDPEGIREIRAVKYADSLFISQREANDGYNEAASLDG
jgi:hypothetical protein